MCCVDAQVRVVVVLGLRSVANHFRVTVTLALILTSDLVSRLPAASGAFEAAIPNVKRGCILGWRRVAYHVSVTVTLITDLVSRIISPILFYL